MKKLLLSLGAVAAVVAPVASVVACGSNDSDADKAKAITEFKKLSNYDGMSQTDKDNFDKSMGAMSLDQIQKSIDGLKALTGGTETTGTDGSQTVAAEFETENTKLATFADALQIAIKSAAEAKTDDAAKTLAVSNADKYPLSLKLVRVLKADYDKQPDYNDHGIAKTIKFTNGIVNLDEQPVGTADTIVVLKFSDAGMPNRIAYIKSVADFEADANVLNWNKGDWTDLEAYLDTIAAIVK